MALGKTGLQLFTLSEEFAADPFETLRRVRQLGATGVEFVGSTLHAVDLRELTTVLRQTGLEPAGVTCEIEELDQDCAAAVDICRMIGCTRIVVPSIRIADCKSKEALRSVASRMSAFAAICHAEKIQLVYHTHGVEMCDVEGRPGIEWLCDAWDPDLVRLEMDTYWVEYAGTDAVSFLQTHGSRCDAVHFKDMKDSSTKQECELGTGIIDIAAVAREAFRQRIEWFVLEQEYFESDPWESVSRGLGMLSRFRDEFTVASTLTPTLS